MCVELIKNLVEEQFNLKLKTRTRKRAYVEARAMYYLLLRKKSRMTMAAISNTLDMNHATVLHSIRSLKNWMEYDVNLKNVYNSLDKKVSAKMRKHPVEFKATKTEEELYVLAYKNLEAKHKILKTKYAYLLSRLKYTSPKTYKNFKKLETNNI